MSERIERLTFFGSLVGLMLIGAFGYGMLTGKGRVWPAGRIETVYQNITSLARFGEFVPRNRRVAAPADASPAAHVLRDPSRAVQTGYFVMLGWDDAAKSYAVWIADAQGRERQRRIIDERRFSDRARTNSNAPHGMTLLADGSVIISYDWLGLSARVDMCGRAIWTRDRYDHHVFAPSADGSIWTWEGRDSAYSAQQALVRLDPWSGRELERIELIGDIIDGRSAALWSVDAGWDGDAETRDLFHPNDVDELLPEMAGAFPMFAAGDLLISIRNLDMVAVIGRDGAVKWAAYGPWRRQHDPDFAADGTIRIFDNNPGRSRSRIWSIRPGDGAENARPVPTPPIYSEYRGKQQVLPGGNLLLTIPEEGRALEIGPDGAILREINNLSAYGPGYHEDLVNVRWVAEARIDDLSRCAD